MLSYTVFVLLVCELGILAPAFSVSLKPADEKAEHGHERPDSKIIAEINPKNIENTVRKLVSFGTRNTLSRRLIQTAALAQRVTGSSEFQKAAAQSEDG